MSDFEQAPEWIEFRDHVKAELEPKMRDSAYVMSLVPDEVDVKFAVELGYAIMLDKPIIALVQPGVQVPEHLVRVADRIIEVDLDDPESAAKRINTAMAKILKGDE